MAWRWARDGWTTRQGLLRFSGGYDKIEHALFFGAMYAVLRLVGMNTAGAWLWSSFAALLNEVKDALMPWERFGWIGGDGFSWRDFVASVGGILLCWAAEMAVRVFLPIG